MDRTNRPRPRRVERPNGDCESSSRFAAELPLDFRGRMCRRIRAGAEEASTEHRIHELLGADVTGGEPISSAGFSMEISYDHELASARRCPRGSIVSWTRRQGSAMLAFLRPLPGLTSSSPLRACALTALSISVATILAPHVHLGARSTSLSTFVGVALVATTSMAVGARDRPSVRTTLIVDVVACAALIVIGRHEGESPWIAVLVDALLVAVAAPTGALLGHALPRPGTLLPLCAVAAAADVMSVVTPTGMRIGRTPLASVPTYRAARIRRRDRSSSSLDALLTARTCAAGEVDRSARENGTLVKVTVRGLEPPSRIGPDATAYVVWVQGRDGSVRRLGTLELDGAVGEFEGLTPLQSFEVFITPEQNPDAMTPIGERVLSAPW